MSFIDISQDFGPRTEPMSDPLSRDALPAGFTLGGCKILEPLSTDGLGILYLAHDDALARDVLIREHFPSRWVQRTEHTQVMLRAGADSQARASALEVFLQEGRWLVRLDNPSIAKVYRLWEQNGTAYMMMPFYQGETLGETLKRMTEPVTETWLRKLLIPVLGALQTLHDVGCYHLALSPERIWLTPEGRPMLLDLSESSTVLGKRWHHADSVDRSYSPIEQFSHGAEFPIGPWTDLYALASVVHQALVGCPPTSAAILGPKDQLAPLAETLIDSQPRYASLPYSIGFLSAIDKALLILPQARPQSVAEFEANMGSLQATHTPADAQTLPEQPGPDGLPDGAGTDPAAQAAIAMAISSLPWLSAQEPNVPVAAPAQPLAQPPAQPIIERALATRADPVTVTIPVAFAARPSFTQTFAPVPMPMPRPVLQAPIAHVVQPSFANTKTNTNNSASHVEPVFQPTSVPPSTLARQWGSAPLVIPQAPARLPNRTSSRVWLTTLLVSVLCALGLGWYATQEGGLPAVVSSAPSAPNTMMLPVPVPQVVPVTEPAPSAIVRSTTTPEPAQPSAIATAPASVVAPAASPAVATVLAPSKPVAAPAVQPPTSSEKSKPQPEKRIAKRKPVVEVEKSPEVHTNPRATCAGKANFSLVYCMQTQCSRPHFSRHPQCVAFRIDGEAR
jgi:serine/threonine protein kinase